MLNIKALDIRPAFWDAWAITQETDYRQVKELIQFANSEDELDLAVGCAQAVSDRLDRADLLDIADARLQLFRIEV